MSKQLITLILLALPMAAQAGNVEAGKQKSQVCQACHGPTGVGTGDPQYPIIAGQYADYLVHSLKGYKSGERRNPIMAGFAGTLTEEDMRDLAAFYAAQPSPLKVLPDRER